MEQSISKFTYKISDVAKMVGVEKHVLRYWENELQLSIARDENGRREYTMEDIECFRRIARLREKGCQMKAIQEILFGSLDDAKETEKPEKTKPSCSLQKPSNERDGAHSFEDEAVWEERMAQIVMQALAQYDSCTAMFWRRHLEQRNEKLEDLLSQMLVELDAMLAEREEWEEERFRRLDETIRAMQRSRAETAATGSVFSKLKDFLGGNRKKKRGDMDGLY